MLYIGFRKGDENSNATSALDWTKELLWISMPVRRFNVLVETRLQTWEEGTDQHVFDANIAFGMEGADDRGAVQFDNA